MNGGFRKKKYTKGPWFNHSQAPLPFQKVVASSSQNADSVRAKPLLASLVYLLIPCTGRMDGVGQLD